MARRRQRNMPAFQAAPGHALEQVLGTSRLGLLLECAERVRLETADLGALRELRQQVPVLGRRPRHLRPQCDEGILDAEGARGKVLGRRAEHVLVNAFARRLDVGVGRDHEHDLVGRAIDRRGRQGDRRGRVPPHRLEQERGAGHLVADEPLVAPIGDDRDVIGQRAQAPIGRLEKGLGRRRGAGRAWDARGDSAGGAGSRRRRP